MGVKGLWQLLEPVGRPVTLESLEGKVLGVDASILLNQAVKGMRDKSGQPLPNAHLIVLFNRLCKLLFYGIKPVFVFDGGVPILKKRTMTARKERKFKARYGSNKAAEKLVKNYLKGKALESVTGKRSGTPLFRNNTPKEPDIFELPSIICDTQDKADSSSASDEDNNVDLNLLEQFYTQKEFENKYQDPAAINVESEDFRSLPEELQHELIKDMMEERKWSMKPAVPQDAFSFSDFQLQSVLQRGKLHQRMDELRKNMNSRNTVEIAGLSSQGSTGAQCTVQSGKIASEDTGHYILVKRKLGNNDEELSVVDNSTEGGFFQENQDTTIQTKPDAKLPQAPTFVDVDLTYVNSSDSELNSPLMDVPEIAVPSSWNTPKVTMLDTGQGSKDHALDVKTMTDAGKEGRDIQYKLSEELLDIGEEHKDTPSRHSETMMLDTEKDGTASDTQHEQSEGLLVTGKGNTDSVNKITVHKGIEIANNTTLHNEQKIIQGNSLVDKVKEHLIEETDTGMEVEYSSTEKQKTNLFGDVNLNEEIESNEDEIQKRKRQIELLLKAKLDHTASSIGRETDVGMDAASNEPVMDAIEMRQTTEDSSVKFILHVDSSEEDEQEEKENNVVDEAHEMEIESEHTAPNDDLNKETNISLDESLSQEHETQLDHSVEYQADDGVTSLVSQFAGSSKEDLEVMQMNLEMEQNSLQSEQARHERAAASVSSEMFTESQELLRLFGVPYLVSPMEAEAQCAFLDLTNQTHGTITDDSDVFLFGGRRVYKHLFNQNKHPELYTSEAITGRLALDRSKLIKLALITGSDYTEGIQGLGAVGAMEVLHEFNSKGFEALQKFKKWHDETKNNKQKNQETKVKKKLRTIKLPTGFPSQEVFDSYINPVIDESRESFEWGKPDLHSLRLFAKEKLGWTTNKTDEILLPVLKQLNKEETQKRIDNFFQIKFQETRKKSSKRVRRVVNRFLNPLSESSSDEEKNNQKNTNSQPTSRKGREKNKSVVSSSSRTSNARGRRKRTAGDVKSKTDGEDYGKNDEDLFEQSDGELERLINSGALNENCNNVEMADPSCVDWKVGQTDNSGRERHGNIKTPKGNQEIQRKDAEDRKQRHDKITQGNRKPVNSNVHQEIHNAKNYRSKSLKTANDFIFNTKECGFSGLRSISEESSTPSDTDSEEERKFRMTSGNVNQMDNIGGRGAGRKRPRGRGRGDRLKKSKTFPVS